MAEERLRRVEGEEQEAMVTAALIAPTAEVASSYETEPPESGDPARVEYLGPALDARCLRFALPLFDPVVGPGSAEVAWLVEHDLAPAAYLAAAVCCAARSSACGPAIAFGAWGASAVLSHVLGALPPRHLEADLFAAPEPSLDTLGDAVAAVPEFLIAGTWDPRVIAMLADDPYLTDPETEVGQDGTVVVRARVTLAPAEGTGIEACSVRLRPSRLVHAWWAAHSRWEQESGSLTLPDERAGSALDPAWLALVPEIPSWAATGDAFAATAAETANRWLSLAPASPSPVATLALRTRAYLAHALAAVAEQAPAIGWAALLDGAENGPAVIAAAARAGIELASPTDGHSEPNQVPPPEESTPGPGSRLAAADGGQAPMGALLGERPWMHEGRHHTVLALGEDRPIGHVLVDGERFAQAGASSSPLPITRAGGADPALWIESALLAPSRGLVEVVAPLLGDKERDLDRLGRLRAILGEHRGDTPVRLVLTRANARKVLDQGKEECVAWSGQLIDALEALLGPGCARLVE